MKDEPGVRALELETPRANVKTLRNLFNDKDAKCGGRVGSLKKSDGPAEVRIPRPSLAPNPSNKPSISARVQQKSPLGSTAREPHGLAAQDSTNLPRAGDASRRTSFERTRAAVAQRVEQLALQREAKAAEEKSPTSGKRSSSAAAHRISPMIEAASVEDENSTSERPSCDASSLSEEEDYVTPISFSKPPPVSDRKASIASPQQSEQAPSPVPPHLPKSPASSPKQKPKLPEPPLYVPPQLVRHPVAPGWRRRELPVATSSCPPKPARPTGMCLPSTSSPQSPTPNTAAQPDRPPLPGRSPPPVPPSRPPPPRPAVPKPPRMLPALPVALTNEPHEDEAASESRQPTSPIPEYTEDEELGSGGGDDGLYADTELDDAPPSLLPPARTPPAPPRPAEHELYQDTMEELYEEMPTDDPPPPVPPPPLIGRGSLPRKDKREYSRLCKAFGLPGGWEQQQPLDAGRARGSSSGGGPRGLDLPLHRGEPVYVLRMEHNPPGKWLVRNSQGEVGYADLANIEVDPNSIKFVMTSQRGPCANSRNHGGGTVHNESDEEEAIYEETF